MNQVQTSEQSVSQTLKHSFDVSPLLLDEAKSTNKLSNTVKETIPMALKRIPRWTNWNGDKMPSSDFSQPKGKQNAISNPNLRLTFESALATKNNGGLGFVFSDEDDLGGIDLDVCRNPKTGELMAWASEFISDFNSYTEISPSGTGVKIFAYGAPSSLDKKQFKMPGEAILAPTSKDPKHMKYPQIEVYVSGRYFTVTGNHLIGTPLELRPAPKAWAKLTEKFALAKEEIKPSSIKVKKETFNQKKLKSALSVLSAKNRDQWIKVGLGIKTTSIDTDFDEATAFEIWKTWSDEKSDGADYTEEECIRNWKSFTYRAEKPRVTIGSIYFLAQEKNWNFDPQNDHEIEIMNKEYAVAWAGSEAIILREYYDPNNHRNAVSFVEPKSIRMMLANKHVQVGEKFEPLFDYWLKHPKRRQYRYIVFEPNCQTPEDYNLWRGWGVKPDSRGEDGCKLFLAHLRDILCSGNTEHYQWTLAWMAQAIQEPNKRPGTAIVWKSGEGAGKDFAISYFGELYGEHYLHLSNQERLTGHFNDHLKHALLVFGDEVFFGGDRQSANILKSIITDDIIDIEPKFKGVVQLRNHIRLILATNERWVLPISVDARRFFMPTVSDARYGDVGYFSALDEEMKDGGPGSLLYYLQHYPIGNIDLRNPPKTEALLEQKHLSLNSVQRFWYERLHEGEPLPNQTDREGWETFTVDGSWAVPGLETNHQVWVRKNAMYQSYIDSSKDVNDKYRDSKEQFWIQIKKLCPVTADVPGEKKKFTRKVFNPIDSTSSTEKNWHRAYLLPSLGECRRAFEAVIRQSVPWPPEEEKPENIKESQIEIFF